MELLYKSEDTFLMAFNRLFQSFPKIPPQLLPFFRLCFRSALKKSIHADSFDIILMIISKLPEDYYSAFDFFFSAFLSDSSVRESYTKNLKKNFLFQFNQKCEKVPVSFLKFAILTNMRCKLTDNVIWSLMQAAPSLNYQFLSRFSEKELNDIWPNILSKIQNYQGSFCIQFVTYYSLLLMSLNRPQLLALFPKMQIRSFFEKLNANSILSTDEMSLFALYMLFSRLNETICIEFASIQNYRSKLANIVSNKGQFGSLVDMFVWVLDPTTEFPFKSVTFSVSGQHFAHLHPPSFTFAARVAPILASLLLEEGVAAHSEEPQCARLVSAVEQALKRGTLVPGKEFEAFLNGLVPSATRSETYFNLLTSFLSISCFSSTFSKVYLTIADDDQKLLNFLVSAASSSPLVNDFLRVDAKHKLDLACMNGTVAIWARFLCDRARVATIKTSSNVKLFVRREGGMFVLEAANGASKFVPMGDDVGGWFFIVVEVRPKTVSISVNLAKVKIEGLFGQSASISIGEKNSSFDLQSLHLFRPELSAQAVCRLFFLGPNNKTNLVDNFISFNGYESLFVKKNNFVSSLYIDWLINFRKRNLNWKQPIIDSKSCDAIFSKNCEFSISPPYGQFQISQKNSKLEKNVSILQKKFHFDSFINSLDAHGGTSLLVHFFAEVILKKRELHCLAFSLFETVVNRFPFIHFFFEQERVYAMLAELLAKSPPVSESARSSLFICAMNKSLITNVAVAKHWLFGGYLFKGDCCEVMQKVLTSLDGEFAEENLATLEIAGAFASVVKAISKGRRRGEELLSVLMALALKMTNKGNAQRHAELIVKHLLVFHFHNEEKKGIKSDSQREKSDKNNEQENQISSEKVDNDQLSIEKVGNDQVSSEKVVNNQISSEKVGNDQISSEKVENNNNESACLKSNDIECQETVCLIHLLGQILFNYGNTVSVSLNLLLPLFLNSPTLVLNSLYDLMMRYMSPVDHVSLIVTLSRAQVSSSFSDYVHSYSTSYIFKASEQSYRSFHNVTIPLHFFLAQEDKSEMMNALFSSSSTVLASFSEFPSFIFDHVYRFLCKLASKNLMSSFFGHEKHENMIQVTPFCHFLLEIITCGLFNVRSCDSAKSFLQAFVVLDRGEYSVFVMSHLFDRLSEYNYEKCQSNALIMSAIVGDIFACIQFVLRERPMNPPPFIPFFIESACSFIERFTTHEIVSSFLALLADISYNNATIALKIVDIVAECKVIQSLPNFKDTIRMLESPIAVVNSKQMKKIQLKFDPSKFVNFIQKVDETDRKRFLSIYCNSLLAKEINAASFFMEKEANDDVFEKWRQVFRELNFPGSKIYSKCPAKYKVDDSAVRHHVRRVLLPMNPSLDSQYLDFWEAKYALKEKKPIVRLTIGEVFDGLHYSHTNDVILTMEASHLHGTSIIHGFFVVSKKSIKFFSGHNDHFLLNFNIQKVHSIRLIDYMHRPIGIFIDEKDAKTGFVHQSTMFSFKTSSLRIEFVTKIEKSLQVKVVRSIDNEELKTVTQSWLRQRITTFDYLLYLNFLSGRTWSDLTRYPIFPWVCLDFSKSEPVMRDMKFPIFAQTAEQRQLLVKYYMMTKEVPDELPHFYTNYVSNVGSALYFLVRLEPFTTEEIAYQGGALDGADRSFQSFEISARVMTHAGEKSALELVPEAYFMPDFLVNVNRVSFPRSPVTNTEISEVKLPNWAGSKSSTFSEGECLSPFKFVRKMRKILESEDVSSELNEWIDIVWGARRAGDAAMERFNVFSPIIYGFDEVKYYEDQKLLNAFSALMHSCGQAPLQLFAEFHPRRQPVTAAAAVKQRLKISAKMENKRPTTEDLFGLGFDVCGSWMRRNEDKAIVVRDSYLNRFVRMRIIQKVGCSSSLEIEKINFEEKSAKLTINFSSEIEPVLLVTSRNRITINRSISSTYFFNTHFTSPPENALSSTPPFFVDFIICHKNSTINHWHFFPDKCQIVHVSTLRGHPEQVTAIALNSLSATAVAGHSDGTVSTFRLNRDAFLMSFSCERPLPVARVAVLYDNSCIIVAQNEIDKINGHFTSIFLTLFEINGKTVAKANIEGEGGIVDCVLTSFASPAQTNLAFVLTDSSKIYAISMNSLRKKAVIDAAPAVLVKLSLRKNAVLVALTSANTLISWNLFDLSKSGGK